MAADDNNDYETAYRRFRWECPERFNFARDVIDRWAERESSKLAMLWVDDHGGDTRTHRAGGIEHQGKLDAFLVVAHGRDAR